MVQRASRSSRRHFFRGSFALAGLGVLAGCGLRVAPATPVIGVPRLGILTPAAFESTSEASAFWGGLSAFGYVPDRNIKVEIRFAQSATAFVERALELLRAGVELIVAANTVAALAARQATSAIPIVMVEAGDPIGTGLIASLARPGGNVTGLTSLSAGLSAKRLDLLKEAAPGLARVALLVSGESTSQRRRAVSETQIAAPQLGLALQALVVRGPEELDGAFERAARDRAGGLIVVGDPLLRAQRGRIAELAARHRLPTMHDAREFAEAGGLLAYGPNLADLYRRAAGYVDRILKGADPAELPVEQPSRFDFIVNLKAAEAGALTVPQSVLLQATQIIQ